jgi:hypothetical protein
MQAHSLLPPGVSLPADCREAAAVLNRGCACVSVDHEALRHALEAGTDVLSHADLLASRPHLFSDTMVFVGEAHLARMAELIDAIEGIVALPAWRERVLAWAPESARHTPRAASVFFGYDFHLGDDGPQLIEINTNAGGGLLGARLLRAQRACCGSLAGRIAAPEEIEAAFVDMFREEWRLARGAETPLRRIAIVDEAPQAQYMAPEFALFRRLFLAAGIDAVIADPRELSLADGRLHCQGAPVDLVYNRLTDFALDAPENAALRAAWLADAAVITPHPQAHALYADKRNLVLLTDPDWLNAIGVDASTRALLLGSIPRTLEVRPETAEEFWRSRRQWFFKPAAGFGSRAAYRGEKLTKRVFEEIARGGYIAQALVPPSERRLLVDGVEQDLKLDLRNYVYRGAVQLVLARLYQGQTTNFRTPGGGFAAVFSVPCQGEKKVCA